MQLPGGFLSGYLPVAAPLETGLVLACTRYVIRSATPKSPFNTAKILQSVPAYRSEPFHRAGIQIGTNASVRRCASAKGLSIQSMISDKCYLGIYGLKRAVTVATYSTTLVELLGC